MMGIAALHPSYGTLKHQFSVLVVPKRLSKWHSHQAGVYLFSPFCIVGSRRPRNAGFDDATTLIVYV